MHALNNITHIPLRQMDTFNKKNLLLYVHCRGDDYTHLATQRERELSGLTLGELLKRKAESGVRVLVMIWGETTSIMGTHDTETENYFKGEL